MKEFKFEPQNGVLHPKLIEDVVSDGDSSVRLIREQCEGRAPLHGDFLDEDFAVMNGMKSLGARFLKLDVQFTREPCESGWQLLGRLIEWTEQYLAIWCDPDVDVVKVDSSLDYKASTLEIRFYW